MTLKTKLLFFLPLALCGIAMGILVLFAADMLFNSGRIAAHSVQKAYPGCDSGCHTALLRAKP